MKWIVFALGFVLAFGGLVAISQGYDIVEIERGWTLVICGATALCAGIVTIALGFVVARIDVLIAVSAQAHDVVAADKATDGRLSAAPVRASAADSAGAAAAASALREAVTANPPRAGKERSAPPGVGPLRELKLPDFSLADLGVRPPLPKPAEPPATPVATSLSSSPAAAPKARPRAAIVAPPRIPAKSVPIPGPWPSEPVSPAEAPKAPAEADQGKNRHAPLMSGHDWLEQELAASEPSEKTEPRLVWREPERAPVPEKEPAAPAVVGRYESNGASYALFDDGSIEAETDSGIYRFASMAELKKFIEGEG